MRKTGRMRRIASKAGSTRFIGRIAPRLHAAYRTPMRDDRVANPPDCAGR
jgi:hypothetical protein